MRDYSSWHPDHRPVAQLWARCANHPARGLVCWGMTAAGRMSILDGDGFHQEHVGGWQPDSEQQMEELIADGVAGWVSKPAEEGVAAHWRWIIHCHQPTCSYEVPLGEFDRAPVVTELLRAMLDYGCDHLVVEFFELFRALDSEGQTPRQYVAARVGKRPL